MSFFKYRVRVNATFRLFEIGPDNEDLRRIGPLRKYEGGGNADTVKEAMQTTLGGIENCAEEMVEDWEEEARKP